MLDLNNFDVNIWEENCRKYDKNHEMLKFKAMIAVIDGQLSIKLADIEKRYCAALTNLINSNAQGAIVYLNNVFLPSYATEEDYEEVQKKSFACLNDHMECYLKILFTKGLDEFLNIVQQQIAILQIQYELSKVEFKDNNWIMPDGSIWNKNRWEKDGKGVYTVQTQYIWNDILGEEQLPITQTA